MNKGDRAWRLQIDFVLEDPAREPTELENLVLRENYLEAFGKAYGMVLVVQEILMQVEYTGELLEDEGRGTTEDPPDI